MAACLSRLVRWKPERRTASFWGFYEPIQEDDGTILADVVVCALCSVHSSQSAATLCKQTKGDKRGRKGIIKCGKKQGAKSARRHVEKSHSRLLRMIENAVGRAKSSTRDSEKNAREKPHTSVSSMLKAHRKFSEASPAQNNLNEG